MEQIQRSDISDFIISQHKNGRDGFSNEGFDHYMTILSIISNKMFYPDKPESKFVELCVSENWEYAELVADTRNKEAFKYCDLFRKFIEFVKKRPEYIQVNRDKQLNKIIYD